MKNMGDRGHPRLYNRSVSFDFKRMEIRVVDRMRKISRKRFIGLAMYHGFSARVSQHMADVVLAHGASYRAGYLLLMKAVNEAVMKAAAEAKNAELDKMVNGCAEPVSKCTEAEALG